MTMTSRMREHLSALLLAGCTGCGAAAVPAGEPSPPPPADVVEVNPPVVVEDACSDGTIVVEAPPSDNVCEKPGTFWPGSCEVPIEIRVRNCTAAPLEIAEIALARDGQTVIQWAFAPGTGPGPGEVWIFSRNIMLEDGTYPIHASFGTVGAPDAGGVELVVTNTTLDAARTACTACNGVFGPHGMLGMVGCLCRTSDAGQPCDDGDDCEGKCIYRDGGFMCSELVTVFGCYSYLPPGWSDRPNPAQVKSPSDVYQVLPERAPSICVD